MLTLGQVKAEDSILQIVAATADSPRFTSLVNKAVRRFLTRGDFVGTLFPIYVCAPNGCVTWPRYVGQVRRMYTCTRNIETKGVWYEFLGWQGLRGWCGDVTPPSGYTGGWNFSAPAVNQGRYPTHKDIQGDGRYVRLYPRCQQDLGKSATIFGVDNGNQTLMHRNSAGDWQEGLVLKLALPYVQSTTFVRRIDRALKEETQCQVLAYAVNTNDSDVLEDLAIWDSTELSPARLRQNVFLGCGCNGNNSGVTALIKAAHVPVKYDEDWVQIPNLDALEFMIQAILLEEGGNKEAGTEMVMAGIQELNMQAMNEMPDLELPIEVSPNSGVPVGLYSCF